MKHLSAVNIFIGFVYLWRKWTRLKNLGTYCIYQRQRVLCNVYY